MGEIYVKDGDGFKLVVKDGQQIIINQGSGQQGNIANYMAFAARGTQTITNCGSWVQIKNNTVGLTEYLDPSSIFDQSTGEMIVTTAGLYCMRLRCKHYHPDGTSGYCVIRRNGNALDPVVQGGLLAGQVGSFDEEWISQLNQGDKITWWVQGGVGGGPNPGCVQFSNFDISAHLLATPVIAPRNREESEIPVIGSDGTGYDAWLSANGGIPPIGITIPATWRAGGYNVSSASLGVWNKIPPGNTRWSFTYNSHQKTGISNNDNENYDFQPYETKCGKFIANGTSTFGQLVGGPSVNWVHVLLTRYA